MDALKWQQKEFGSYITFLQKVNSLTVIIIHKPARYLTNETRKVTALLERYGEIRVCQSVSLLLILKLVW